MAEGSSLAEDLFSEIIPADEAAFVGCVIVAVFLCLDHVYQKTCKVVGVGRSSDLVTDYGKLVMGFSQIYHGTDKVFAVFAEYPCNTYDKEFIYSAGYCQLTVKLGLTVYVLWSVVLAVRIPWCGSLAVKNVVCGNIHHLDAKLLADVRNVLCSYNIDKTYLLTVFLVLCSIYGCPCGTVYYCIRLYLTDGFCYRFFICDIKLHIRHGGNRSTISDAAVGRSNVTSYAFMSTAGQFIHYVMAKLAANTCYEKSHALTSSRFPYIFS